MIGGGDRLELVHRAPIGDRHSAALTGTDGTIDWWTPLGVDQPATFFRLVDDEAGGALGLSIDPGVSTPPSPGTQTWAGAGPIVETILTGTESTLRIRDLIIRNTIFRELTALRGPLNVVLDVEPGHRFGPVRRHSVLSDGMSFGPTSVRGLAPDQPTRLDAGERILITVSPVGTDQRITTSEFETLLSRTNREWKSNLECNYDGRFRAQVQAALKQLLLLTNPANGALIRALTTSLPARTGHERQVDSRLCWIDDAARFVDICERLERFDLADPTRDWVANAIDDPSRGAALSPNGEQIGRIVDLGLPGWRGHQPVTSGHRGAPNVDLAAVSAASLVLDARRHRRQLANAARFIHLHAIHGGNELEPDAGRWGGLGRLQRHTSAAIAARGALNAAARTERRFDPLSEEAADWQATAKRLNTWLASDGCFGSADRRGWRRTDQDDTSDAQLLRWIVQVSGRPKNLHVEFPGLPDDADFEAHRRSELSIDQTLAQLDDAGFLHRHLAHVDDGFAPGQPADLAASAEMVSALAGLGRWDEAVERMERLTGVICASGTFTAPTFVKPQSGTHRGDRPSAPTLLAFIEAAIALESAPV